MPEEPFDPDNDPDILEKQAEALKNEYDSAVENADHARSEEILREIHEIDVKLGRDEWNPEEEKEELEEDEAGPTTPPGETIEQKRQRIEREKLPEIIRLARMVLERPDDLRIAEQLRMVLMGNVVLALSHQIPARRFHNRTTGRAETFLKITDDLVVIGEGPVGSHGFAKVSISSLESARALMENLKQQPEYEEYIPE